jgi:hypothetical protein
MRMMTPLESGGTAQKGCEQSEIVSDRKKRGKIGCRNYIYINAVKPEIN